MLMATEKIPPGPPLPKGGSKNKGLAQGIKVLNFLATRELLEWKSLKEVAAGAGVTLNVAYASLCTLGEAQFVEKSDKGFRLRRDGSLMRYAVAALEAIQSLAQQMGFGGINV
jgi:DNA-binding IclR family transcriptional regulator